MTSPITLKDLAKISGLAPSTISRALQGHPDISDETQKRVQALASELNYKPNLLARNLRKQESNLVAIIVPDITNYFFTCVVKNAIEYANQQGYQAIIFDSNDMYEREVEICSSIKKSGIRGVLVAMSRNTRNSDHFKELKANGVTLTFFQHTCGDIDTDRIVTDDFHGAYSAVEHMIAGGCKHIVHFSANMHMLYAQKRQMGYMQALKDHRIPVDNKLIIPYDREEITITTINKLINKHHIDGIFTVDDQIAVIILHQLKKMNISIPQQIAVCGFTNTPIASATIPTLTTIELDGLQMGKIGMELLLKNNHTDTETRILKTKLIIRESTKEINLLKGKDM